MTAPITIRGREPVLVHVLRAIEGEQGGVRRVSISHAYLTSRRYTAAHQTRRRFLVPVRCHDMLSSPAASRFRGR